jgi:hypothetical protein
LVAYIDTLKCEFTKLLLTSGGVSNPGIREALSSWLHAE